MLAITETLSHINMWCSVCSSSHNQRKADFDGIAID